MGNSFQTTYATPGDLAYPTRLDVETIFGPSNVERWADNENDGDADYVLRRITWARVLATQRVDDRLRDGPYAVPFETPYPSLIVDCAARLAGVLLYDSRGYEDESEDGNAGRPAHSLAAHQRRAERLLDDILAGRVYVGVAPRSATYPQSFVPANSYRPYSQASVVTVIDPFGTCD